MFDTTMTLPDGRVLGFTELGSSSGPLVLYFHGAPSSRLDLTAYDEAFAAVDVRVVCPDRPGYGKSSPQPGRRLDDWPAELPERVAAAAVVAGVTDFSWPDAYEGYDDLWITISRFGDETQATAWCDEHLGADGSRLMEQVPELAPADHAFLEDAATANVFAATMAEAFRQGTGGFAQDLTIEGRPWAFDPGTIAVPVRILHGEADTLAPLAHARHTAELIPGSAVEILPGHGHVSMFNESQD